MSLREVYFLYPDSLNKAVAWLVSGLITTESELIGLALQYEALK